ncbi:hypothetical protein ACKE5C_19020 (plasmid) [Aneurinibacillus thermoaerophilus]|uniref:Uncharacterized protein n=1 Tax=Aneurinibacillus thermoaerophilus TaxID=143495 RepID=A0ABX8YGL3_ANETH|nr:hypothetical protein [Aneurinibacillus thermoaerophilus]QYY44801.1 hypothetical protein K3F53_18880 [Aneurinibacillus thermoaerophilus]
MVAEWELEEVDVFVNRVANSQVKHFYPTAAAKYTGLPLHLVFERLLKLVDSKKLVLKWEIRCPSYGCGRTVDTTDKLADKVGEELQCVCGEDIEVITDIIFPVFELNPEYKEHIKKKGSSRTLVLREKRITSPGTPVSLSSKELVSQDSKALLEKHAPPQIINHITVHGDFRGNIQGEIEMTDNRRNMSGNNFGGANFSGNVNFQGDDVRQTQTVHKSPIDDAFLAFIEEIKKMPDSQEKKDALSDVEAMQEAVKNGNLDRAKRIYGLLSNAVRDTAAGMTIAKLLGFIAGA